MAGPDARPRWAADPALPRRVATAVVGAVLVLAGVLLLPAAGVAAVAALVALAAAWEWARLAGVREGLARGAYVALLALVVGGSWALAGALAVTGLLVAAVAWWCGVGLWLALGARPRAASHGVRPGWLAVGLLLLPSLALGIVWLARADGPGRWVLLYAICLVWVADVGAYFAGRACGRRRLAPAVSAGKTWEGLAGGLAAVALYALAGAAALGVPPRLLGAWIALALAAAVVSVVGDLLESVLKREAGVKDSGTMLPGHGGLLDRIDSLTAAIPVLALGLGGMPLAATG